MFEPKPKQKINKILIVVIALTVALSSITILYFIIENTRLINDKIIFQEELWMVRSKLSTQNSKYTTLKNQYDTLNLNYTNLKRQYEKLDENFEESYVLKDPTYREAMQFVDQDQTNKNQYDEETYTCVNFVSTFKNNAFKQGYKCGYIDIEFPVYAHAIVCFDTTDKGRIYIEPQLDDIVTLKVGKSYSNLNNYASPTFDDTITRIIITW